LSYYGQEHICDSCQRPDSVRQRA